jgi:hypothetical protein
MRATPLIAAALLAIGLVPAVAQTGSSDSRMPVVLANAGYDDLSCAARYELAAFVIQDMDVNAAGYYTQRASAAGKRYLATHPGESEASYTSRVTANAQNLQARLSTNAITPEGLVSEIKQCDQAADSRVVT